MNYHIFADGFDTTFLNFILCNFQLKFILHGSKQKTSISGSWWKTVRTLNLYHVFSRVSSIFQRSLGCCYIWSRLLVPPFWNTQLGETPISAMKWVTYLNKKKTPPKWEPFGTQMNNNCNPNWPFKSLGEQQAQLSIVVNLFVFYFRLMFVLVDIHCG